MGRELGCGVWHELQGHLGSVCLPYSGEGEAHSTTAFCILEAIELLDQGRGYELGGQGLSPGFTSYLLCDL